MNSSGHQLDHQLDQHAEHTPDLPLRGRALRFVLVDELRRRETMTVADMAAVLADHGYDLAGRASKIISDALRWELARQRVQRLRRGVYRYHHAPTSTARRIRIFAATCRTWLVAQTRTQQLSDAPNHQAQHDQAKHDRAEHDRTRPVPRNQTPQPEGHDPAHPPWEHLGWLWAA